MKKFYSVFIVSLLMFSLQGKSQIACNPDFTHNFITGSTVQFIPVNTSTAVQHYWKFGDGSAPSNAVSPSHSYAPGIYNVKHFVVINDPNGVQLCNDSTTRVITIQQGACNLNASFTSQNSTSNPLQIYFVNTSSGFNPGDSIRWTFGDGTVSYDINPSHIYTSPGTYNVCLRVKKQNSVATAFPCVSEICHAVTVTSPTLSCNLQVYFATQNDPAQPGHIYFSNQSIGYVAGDSVKWNFGDGTFAYTYNTDHTYSAPGTYTVCLTIKKNNNAGTAPCIRTYCKIVTVAAPCNLVAGFTWTGTASSPYTYLFTNTSAPLSTTDSVRWTFGDGTSSNSVNPNHTYAQPGTYIVCLRVQQRTAAGVLTNCIKEICQTIIVQGICNIQPAFTWQADAQNTKKIYFTNTTASSPANAGVTWFFGDGTSASTWNAIHTYAQAGTYNVCLRIQFGACITYHCDSVTVTLPPVTCMDLANFHTVPTTVAGTYTTFVANNIFTDVQYTWTFGDGTGMQGPTATHQYAAPGTYTVCLTAYRNNTCASTKCMTITVPALFNCNNITIGFTNVPNPTMPNSVKFTATSNATITNQVWTITKTPATAAMPPVTINANNPTHVFTVAGYYNVCLQATYSNGCVKHYCRTIYVSMTASSPALCTMQVYPNPASSSVNAIVSLTQPLVLNAYIYNNMNMLVAQKVQQGVIGNNTITMNISNLTPGVYTLKVVYGNQVCNATFIKQ
ncbi:MAG: PKD domain-containing protein [Ferruginibacter sp.]